jgi:methylase of polypeptide subunit release factors
MPVTALSHEKRRLLGRYDTPLPLAQSIVDWAVRSSNDRVLEPSVGGGAIALCSIRRLRQLGNVSSFQNVWGCDVDSSAIDETRTTVNGPINLIRANFLDLDINQLGAVPFTAVIGNPPFIRLHMMDKETRESVIKQREAQGVFGQKASLWAYFPVHSLQLVAEGGRMAWILPEALLHAVYAKKLLPWLASKFERTMVVSLRERCFERDGAQERVVALLLDGAHRQQLADVSFVEYVTATAFISAVSSRKFSIMRAKKGNETVDCSMPQIIPTGSHAVVKSFQDASILRPLGEFASVSIGVVTGANHFFVLTEEQRKSLSLNRRHFIPVVRKFSDLDGIMLLNDAPSSQTAGVGRHWLLVPKEDNHDHNLAAYLNQFSMIDRENNETMHKRTCWFRPFLGKKPDAFFRCMGDSGPRVVLNNSNAYCTNSIYSVNFNPSVSDGDRKVLCLLLHSSYCQLSAEIEGRQYGSGVLKLEPSEAKRIKIPFCNEVLDPVLKIWDQFIAGRTTVDIRLVVQAVDLAIEQAIPELPILAGVRSAVTLFRARRRGGRTFRREK